MSTAKLNYNDPKVRYVEIFLSEAGTVSNTYLETGTGKFVDQWYYKGGGYGIVVLIQDKENATANLIKEYIGELESKQSKENRILSRLNLKLQRVQEKATKPRTDKRTAKSHWRASMFEVSE